MQTTTTLIRSFTIRLIIDEIEQNGIGFLTAAASWARVASVLPCYNAISILL
jgi:hypothetical protein